MRRRARAARCGAHRQGKFALGGSVGLSVGRSVGSGPAIDLPSWSVSFRAVCGCWASGFCQSSETGIWVSRLFFVSLGRSAALFVRVCWHDSSGESALCSFPSAPSFVLVWAHAVI